MTYTKEKITLERVTRAIEECNGEGFCLTCGNSQYGVEPDAENYECENCNSTKVFGAEQIAIFYF